MPPHLRPLVDAVVRAAANHAARSAGYWEILVRDGEDEALAAWGDGARQREALSAALAALESALASFTEDR